jgi:tRNA(Ile)-lysidine synthase
MKVLTTKISKFLQSHDLMNFKSVAIAVSGGIDSMVLAHVAIEMRRVGLIKQLSFIHINHKFRDQSELEAKFIKSFSILNEVDLIYFEMPKTKNSNLEKSARDFRYQCFNKVSADKIFMAHHIDDSYEWHLMQKFKSSSLKTSLGIPVRRERYVRPFMCLTKNQIKKVARENKVKYFDDHSNNDLKFERNYMRHEIIPNIQKRYPNYLKHYVNYANELARDLGLHQIKKNLEVQVIQKDNFSYILDKSFNSNFTGSYGLIENEIKRLSTNTRGKLNSQIGNIVSASKNFKSGPIDLSGGVKAYLYPNLILLSTSAPAISRSFIAKKSINSLSDLISTLSANNETTPLFVKKNDEYIYLTKYIKKLIMSPNSFCSELKLYI